MRIRIQLPDPNPQPCYKGNFFIVWWQAAAPGPWERPRQLAPRSAAPAKVRRHPLNACLPGLLFFPVDPLYCLLLVLWIRIGFTADPYPVFFVNADTDPDLAQDADPDPVFWWTKIGNNLQLKNLFYCFDQKLHFTYPWVSTMDVQAIGEVFIPQKRTSSTRKFEFASICGSFWPSWIRIRFLIPNADPDPADQTECGSGSTTLRFLQFLFKSNKVSPGTVLCSFQWGMHT